MDTDSFVLSVNTHTFIKDLENLEEIFDFRNFNENIEFFGNKNRKVADNFKIET